MWSNSLKTAVFASVLVEYLSSGQLAGLQQVSDQLGSKHALAYATAYLTKALSEGGVERPRLTDCRRLSSWRYQRSQ
jgi:hypothetical protein